MRRRTRNCDYLRRLVKILFYNHTGKVSGAERVMLMILSKIDRERFDSLLLCPEDGPLREMTRSYGVRTIEINSLAARFTWRPDRLIGYFASFARLMREARALVIAEAPDIVHANSIRAGLVMSAATVGRGLPVIWHAHDLLPRHPLSSAIRLFTLASRRNQILAVSDAVANRFRGVLLRLFSQRVPITVIHNAVDVKEFQPNLSARREIRCSLGFPENQLLIGSVGQLTARKGQLELIKAFAEVAEEFPKAALLIAGTALFNRDFEYAESLRQTTNNLGISDRVRFIGQCEDIPALMRAFDVVVVNSRAEPFGLTVVEGMASGIPVLVTAVDGIKEIVDHDRNGWLVHARDHHALVQGLRKLLIDVNLRARLSARGFSDARSRFCSNIFLSRIQTLYRQFFETGITPQRKSRRNQIECGLKI